MSERRMITRPDGERLAIAVEEAAHLLGISRSLAYELCARRAPDDPARPAARRPEACPLRDDRERRSELVDAARSELRLMTPLTSTCYPIG